jgi:hypothetical protein
MVNGGDAEPSRIYIYNLETNSLIYDFRFDTSAEAPGDLAFSTHAPVLERDEDGNGVFYKIRLTGHVREILDGMSENVNLDWS